MYIFFSSLQFSLDESQLQQDWAILLSLASQPGASLEQLHIFALAHILRYGEKKTLIIFVFILLLIKSTSITLLPNEYNINYFIRSLLNSSRPRLQATDHRLRRSIRQELSRRQHWISPIPRHLRPLSLGSILLLEDSRRSRLYSRSLLRSCSYGSRSQFKRSGLVWLFIILTYLPHERLRERLQGLLEKD